MLHFNREDASGELGFDVGRLEIVVADNN